MILLWTPIIEEKKIRVFKVFELKKKKNPIVVKTLIENRNIVQKNSFV